MLKWFKYVAAVVVAMTWLASSAFATTLAYDGFDYTGSLNTQNGGTGFSAAWAASGGLTNPALASGSMTYSDGTRNLIVVGNKVQPTASSRSARNFSSTIATANQTLWVSFRINHTGTGTLPTNHAGFSLFSGTAASGTEIFMGHPANATNWGAFHSTGPSAQKSGSVTASDRDAFLVYKLVFTSTQVTISMWVDPSMASEASMGASHITPLVATHNTSIASLRVSTGTNASNYQFDEFRFGTTFADIAPTGQLLAYDGFNYTGSLNGQSGGSGFGAAWAASGGLTNPALATGSMTYSDGTNSLTTIGNKVQPAAGSRSARNFSSTIATANRTLWVSFRINHTGTGTLPTNHAGFSLFSGTAASGTEIFMGHPANATNWGAFHSTGPSAQKSGSVSASDRDALLLYKLVFTSTQVTISMWVDPNLASEGSLGASHITPLVASHSTSVASLRVSTGTNASSYQFDEFRLGTTFSDVTPNTPSSGGGNTIVANDAAAFTAALVSAQPGDTIVLNAGTTYTGTFTLTDKGSSTSYITIRSSNISSLPAAGVRVNTSHASNMPKVRAPNSSGGGTAHLAINTTGAAHHWKFIGVEFIAAADDLPETILIEIGKNNSTQTQLSQVPHHITFDRCIARANSGTQRLRRAFALHSADTEIINSRVADCKDQGSGDSQAVSIANGPGPYLIDNCFLEAASEHILVGGSPVQIVNMVPTGITVTRNHFFKPLAWKTQSWNVKNHFELKSGRDVVVNGNIMENCWHQAGDFKGTSISLKRIAQPDQGNTWTATENVTISNNIIRNVGLGISIAGSTEDHWSSTGGIVWTTVGWPKNVTIRNNLWHDITGPETWSGNQATFINMGSGSPDTVFDHNTAFINNTGSNGSRIAEIWGGPYTGFIFTNNIVNDGVYNFRSSLGNGEGTFDNFMPASSGGMIYRKNVTADVSSSLLLPNYHGDWNPTGLAFPIGFSTVLVNYGTPGSNYAGWKVQGWDQPTNTSLYPYNNTAVNASGVGTGKDIGCDIDALNAATAGCISGSW